MAGVLLPFLMPSAELGLLTKLVLNFSLFDSHDINPNITINDKINLFILLI
jgi:hypothetical protein